VTSRKGKDRIHELLVLLDGLTRLHGELRSAVTDKIARMRAASIAGMHECVRREESLVLRVSEQEGLRKQLMDAIGRGFGAGAQKGRTWTAAQLADRLLEPQRGELLAAARRLRESVAEVARVNRMAGMIAQEVLKHYRHVFASMQAGGAAQPAGYSRRGDVVSGSRRTLFDAVA
jgi:hypothetical protein